MAELPIPPWLAGPKAPGETFLGGFEIGQKGALERARLAQQAAEAAQRAALHNRELAIKEQRAKDEVAYETGRLKLHQDAEAIKGKIAAQRFLGQDRYRRNLQSGMNQNDAFMDAAPDLLAGDTEALVRLQNFQRPPAAPDPYKLGQEVPVTGGGRVVVTGRNQGVFRPEQQSPAVDPVAQRQAAAFERENEMAGKQIQAKMLLDKEKALREQMSGKLAESRFKTTPGLKEAMAQEYKGVTNSLAQLYPPPSRKESAAPTPAKSKAQQRADAANRLEKEHKDWSDDRIMQEVYKLFP